MFTQPSGGHQRPTTKTDTMEKVGKRYILILWSFFGRPPFFAARTAVVENEELKPGNNDDNFVGGFCPLILMGFNADLGLRAFVAAGRRGSGIHSPARIGAMSCA